MTNNEKTNYILNLLMANNADEELIKFAVERLATADELREEFGEVN